MKTVWSFILMSFFLVNSPLVFAENEQQKKADAAQQKNEEGLIEISADGQKAAGIQTEILEAKSLPIYLSAPGEVIPNTNLTSLVSSRIPAQVEQRFAEVGEHVKKDQVLVRLTSVNMAKAQANLLLTEKEWNRIKELGKPAISAKRYQSVESAFQQAYSTLLAYGMTKKQIDSFLKSDDASKANGEFTLLAQRDGTVFSADFTEGQMVSAGTVLYKIVDESSLWVDAKLSNGDSATVRKGTTAIIQTPHINVPATVLQVHHKLDETTRTRVVRLNVENLKDELHPGEFVTCLIKTGETKPVLAVKSTALMRTPDNDMAVYLEVKPNHFRAEEVKIIEKIGDWRVIDGVTAGDRVVTQGAFFVHSESLKGGFNTHNH